MTAQQAEILLTAIHTIDGSLAAIADELKELRKHAEQQTRALESIAESLASIAESLALGRLRPVR